MAAVGGSGNLVFDVECSTGEKVKRGSRMGEYQIGKRARQDNGLVELTKKFI
jgi:hypothetical protein